MQVDLVATCLYGCKGPTQRFGIELGNQATPRDNLPIPKISSKLSKAIEDLLNEVMGIPMQQSHPTKTLVPTYPVGMNDNRDEIEKDLVKDWLWLVTGADLSDKYIHIDAKTLTMESIVPM